MAPLPGSRQCRLGPGLAEVQVLAAVKPASVAGKEAARGTKFTGSAPTRQGNVGVRNGEGHRVGGGQAGSSRHGLNSAR